jgi:hypothetical protein
LGAATVLLFAQAAAVAACLRYYALLPIRPKNARFVTNLSCNHSSIIPNIIVPIISQHSHQLSHSSHLSFTFMTANVKNKILYIIVNSKSTYNTHSARILIYQNLE